VGLIGYVRVSRIGGREGEGYISPSVQRDAINAYAAEMGEEIVRFADDQDYSGGNTERPAFQAALDSLEAGEAGGIVVMKIDRFARSVPDGVRIVREIVDREQIFASCHERIDPRTPEGRFMLTSFLANAELFLDQIKAGWKVSKAKAIARGVHIGPTPIGYRREKSKPLLVDPLYGPAIGELFDRASGGEHGDTALARWMDERAPVRGGRTFQPSEIRRWLSNRLYLGEVRYGELVNTEAHPALTDSATWELCQRAPGVQHRPSSPFLLRGLIRCAHCRYAMGGQSAGGGDGRTPIYRCTRNCEGSSVITAERVEGYVLGLIRREGPLRVERLEGAADFERIDREAEASIAEVQAFVADLEARRLLGEEGWREGLRVRVADQDAKLARRERRRREIKESRLLMGFDDLSRHDLRDLLGGMISAIFVRRGRGRPAADRVLVVWSDQTVDFPGPHRPGPFEPIVWE